MSKSLLIAVFLVLFLVEGAFAGLQVFPFRLQLNDTKRVAHLSLRYSGEKPADYKISTIFYRMKPDGSINIVQDAKEEERPATKLIQYSPHQVQLAPNAEQVIRVRLSGPRNIPDGEYRAHLLIEPMKESAETAADGKKPAEKMGMKLDARIAVAIPVVFSHGKTQFNATLSKFQIMQNAENKPVFSVEMSSNGNAFPYGDLEVLYQPTGGQVQSVGTYRGVASFLPARTFSFPLKLESNSPLLKEIKGTAPVTKISSGKLRVEFHEPQENGKDGKLITSVDMPNS